MTAVEKMRQAARLLRTRAAEATPGAWDFQPWTTYTLPSGEYGESILLAEGAPDGEIVRELGDADGRYIAMMQPAVAHAVAVTLDNAADDVEMQARGGGLEKQWDIRVALAGQHAEALAEAVLLGLR